MSRSDVAAPGSFEKEAATAHDLADACAQIQRSVGGNGLGSPSDVIEAYGALREAMAGVRLEDLDRALTDLAGVLDRLWLISQRLDGLIEAQRGLRLFESPAPTPGSGSGPS